MTTNRLANCPAGYFLSLALTALALISPHGASAATNLWLTDTDIQSLQSRPGKTAPLLRRCEQEIDAAPSPVAVFAPPPHYSNGGVVETDMSKHFASDGGLAFRAALCYVASKDIRFAKHAQTIISAWADTLQSVSSEQGASEINFDLPQFVLAASMVRDVGGWDDQSFRHLLTRIALPLSHSNRKNNHANWGVLLNASIAAYTGDVALLAAARARWLALMDGEVAGDGSLPLEICRSDTSDYCGGPHKGINGISYTHYTLLPTTATARIFELQGRPVWQTPQGSKLAQAYRQAAAWTRQPETFPYFGSNGGHLNGVRNAAYFALLQRQFPNEDGAQVIADGKLGMNGLEWLIVFN